MQRRKQTLGGRIFLDRRGEIRGEALNDPLVQREAPGARGHGPAPRGQAPCRGYTPTPDVCAPGPPWKNEPEARCAVLRGRGAPPGHPCRAAVRPYRGVRPYPTGLCDDAQPVADVDRSYADKIALTEAAYRIANERMAQWAERYENAPVEIYFCECGDRSCRAHVLLTKEQYEAVRRDSRRFLIVPGHEMPTVETVIESYETYEVVEKLPDLLAIVTEADPRQRLAGPSRDEAEATATAIQNEERRASNVPRVAVPPDHVELTCTRDPCHVVYVVPADLVPLLRGCTCPKCGKGVLELRDLVSALPR
jgi:hypothetical protein